MAHKAFDAKNLEKDGYLKLSRLWKNAITRIPIDYQKHDYLRERQIIWAVEQEWKRRASGVPALPEWFDWPSTRAPLGDGQLLNTSWPEYGVLSYFGYHVGFEGAPETERRLILAGVFTTQIPSISGILPQAYVDEWGLPRGTNRLCKMAQTIAALTRNAKRRRDPALKLAIRDWESDLQFLYKSYYVGMFHFDWPTP